MNRSTLIVIGLVLALLGGAGLLIESLSYNDREQILDAGPIEASAEVEREVTIPPLAAGGVLGLGLVVTLVGVNRKS